MASDAVSAVVVSLPASAHLPHANCLDEWPVPDQSGTSTGLDRNRDRNRIPISILIPGMVHPSLYFNQTASQFPIIKG